jgi:hypothetical protein
MSRQSQIHRAAVGRAAAFSLFAAIAAGAHHPAEAQPVRPLPVSGGALTGVLAANPGVGMPVPSGTWVQSPADLVNRLQDPQFTGTLIIPRDVSWDMSAYSEIPIRSGIAILGDRGALGSRPLLYTTNKSQDFNLFDVTGNDVRIEGLHVQGPEAGNIADGQKAARAFFILEDADHQLGRRIVITDNELNEWTTAGVEARGDHAEVALPGDYDPSWAVLRPQDAGLVRVEGNYIHNNGRGYGVVVDGGAYVTIEGNVFNYNWHDVASDGHAHSGYIARFNYVMQGGFEYDSQPLIGGYWNQHFDVHGTAASGDHHNGGTAGEYYLIADNTIRGDQGYYVVKTRPAFELRGRPAIGAFFDDNIVVHGDFGAAVRLDTGDDSSLDDDNPSTFNLEASGNQFGTDHSLDVAAGDFDGDGHTDVFLATGTAWFYSRGGSQPWTYLQPSGLLLNDLAFADIDNDGITDVVWRGPDGTLYYWKGGKGNPIPLIKVPVPVSQLRFGDFDGDGKTDIFYTQNGVWNFWYSRTQTWGSPGGSSFPLSELLFADMNGDGKTDIVGIAANKWAYSSSGSQPWATLNGPLTNTFSNAVVGDFDGNGRNDILFSTGDGKWYISRGGTGPAQVWREESFPDLDASPKSLLLGHFDGDRRTELAGFASWTVGFQTFTENRLVIWRAAGSVSAFSELSPQDMR